MMFALRDALSVGSIHLSNEFFCLTQGVIPMKNQLEDELRNYCVIVEPAKTPFGKCTFSAGWSDTCGTTQRHLSQS